MSQLNTAHRNNILDLGVRPAFAGGRLRVYSGAVPAVQVAATGTLLLEIVLPSPAFLAAVAGVIALTGSWSGVAIATGTPTYARLSTADDTQYRQTVVGAEITLGGLVGGEIVSGSTVTVMSYTIAQPSGS